MIYLDNAATTFPKPEEVYQAVDYTQRNMAVNVGRGSYKVASDAMKIVDETRYLMAELFGVENPNNVVFAPSATVAANQIIMGLEWDEYKTVYITPFEHNAIARPLHLMQERYNFEIVLLPFDSETQELDKEEAENLFLQNPPDYVFANHISNVTGAIVPIEEITELAGGHLLSADECFRLSGAGSGSADAGGNDCACRFRNLAGAELHPGGEI